MNSDTKHKCSIDGCEDEVKYQMPNYLCAKHWQMWYDYKLKVKSRFTGRMQ